MAFSLEFYSSNNDVFVCLLLVDSNYSIFINELKMHCSNCLHITAVSNTSSKEKSSFVY